MAASLAVREFLHSGYPGQLVSFHRSLFLHAFFSPPQAVTELGRGKGRGDFFLFYQPLSGSFNGFAKG